MRVSVQAIILASLTISTVRCLTIPSSFEKTVALLEETNQEQQSHSYDGSQISSDSDRGYPVVSTTIIRDDDELSNEEKTLALAATVYDNLAPLVQLAGAQPDKKPTEGITKTKSGYSKVITTTVAARQQGDTSDSSSARADSSSTANEAAVVVDDITSETSSASEGGIGKSIEKSKEGGVVGGGGANKYHAVGDEDEEDEDVFDVENIAPSRGDSTQFSPSLSAKEYMAIFMRENLLPASQSTSGPQSPPGSQPMAAKLTINDDASATSATTVSEEDPEAQTHMREEMEKRLADFVEKFMSGVLQAKMHEVRVEQRANGLQDYRTS